jgi:hypothetical protein
MANLTSGREHPLQMTHYMRRGITVADAGTTVEVGVLPPYAAVIRAGVVVSTVFNGGSTNTLDIGTEDDTDDFATDLALGTKGVIVADEMATADNVYNTTAKIVKAVVVSTANATTGVGTIFVEYIVNNDG